LRVLTLVLAVLAAWPGRARADDTPPAVPVRDQGCESARPTDHLLHLFGDQKLDDVHYVVQTLETLCPDASERFRWQLLDALALFRLEDRPRSRALLVGLVASPGSPVAAPAAVLLSWSYLRDGDGQAFSLSLERVAPAAQRRLLTLQAVVDSEQFEHTVAALDPDVARRARVIYARYRNARPKRPWLAGTLSAILPGLGQVYAGSWQSAAVAFVLNSVFIGATVELARNHLYFSAGTTGVAASVFYLGNIFNAADLAQRRNDLAAQPEYDQLERVLVPEAWAEGF